MNGTVKYVFFSIISHDKTNWTPLPESNATEAKEAANIIHQTANSRIGKAISQAEIFGIGRTGCFGQDAENDGRSGEDVVSKQEDKVEVSRE